jgi:signal transduction histidine kinase
MDADRTHRRVVRASTAANALAAVGLLVATTVVHGTDHGSVTASWQVALALAVGAAGAAALLMRRRWQIGGFALMSVALLAEDALRHQQWLHRGPDLLVPGMAVVLARIAASRTGSKRLTAAVAGGAVGVMWLGMVLAGDWDYGPATSRVVLVVAATAVGLFVGTRRAYVDQLRERAERLEHERELVADNAVAQERIRIARELHDVLAHNVSLMVVQAGAMGERMGSSHELRATCDALADTGRTTLSELRRLLGLLRPDEGAGLAPQPGAGALDTLVTRTRAAGLDARLDVRGAPRALPAGVSLSAYRIVQEALTNVIRHASATTVRVSVTYSAHELELLVVDDGVCRDEVAVGPTAALGPGHGILGMRERATLCGGTLDAGAQPGGGFAVRARLPFASSVPGASTEPLARKQLTEGMAR